MYGMLHSIVLALHLLFMNLASALPLFAIIAQYSDARNPGGDLSYARRLAKVSLHSLLGGILFGLALAGLMWISGQSHFFQMLPRFAYKIYWAIGELFFFVACMMGYLRLLPTHSPLRRSRHLILTTLAVLASLNLLYHFPPLFSVMHWSRVTAENVPERVGPREFWQLMLTSRYTIPMLVHFALASIAVAGVFVMHEKSTLEEVDQGDDKERTAERSSGRRAAGIAFAATTAQFLVGPWLLLSLPHVAQYRLLGEDLVGTVAFLLSLLLAFGLLHQLASSTFGDTSPREARKTALWLILITVLMTMTLGRMDAEMVRARADVSDSARAREPINGAERRCGAQSRLSSTLYNAGRLLRRQSPQEMACG